MRTTILLAAAALSLSACATTSGIEPPDTSAPAERVSYETAACFGPCPVYSVTVDTQGGAGEFIGMQHTATAGAARFRATPAQVRAFRAAVAGLRAVEGEGLTVDSARCKEIATDQPSVTVTWIGAGGMRTVKRAYYGCFSDANRPVFAALQSVPDVLPIKPLIGK